MTVPMSESPDELLSPSSAAAPVPPGDAEVSGYTRRGARQIARAVLRHPSALVSVGYGAGEVLMGGLAVVGPTRMDYPQALATVEVVSDRLAKRLGEGAA